MPEDFNDANENGIDDKEESLEDRQTSVRGVDPSEQTDTAALTQMEDGQRWFNSMMEDYMTNPGDQDDELRNSLRTTLGMDQLGKWMDSYSSRANADYSVGSSKDVARFTNLMDRLTSQEQNSQNFILQNLMAQNAYGLTNNLENARYVRDVNLLGASGYQTRQNAKAFGQQDRLGMIVGGEQFRLNTAATGEQSRLGIITAGEQQRLGILATGDQTRKNIDAQGLQDRLGWQTQGKEQRKNIAATGIENRLQAGVEGKQTRKNIAATGVENRLQAQTEGQQTRKNIAATGVENRLQSQTEGLETRKNIAATGVENRLQAVTEGEQARLNIGKTAEEQRSTMSHSDLIAAGREKRQNAAARAGVRAT